MHKFTLNSDLAGMARETGGHIHQNNMVSGRFSDVLNIAFNYRYHCLVAAPVLVTWCLFREDALGLASKLLIKRYNTKVVPFDRTLDMRDQFRGLALVKPTAPKKNKPHPELNAQRNAANYSLLNFGRTKLGRPVLCLPVMHKDPVNSLCADIVLSDNFRNARYQAQEKREAIGSDFVKIIDLDNQTDMRTLLLTRASFGIYCFNPKRAAHSGEEYSYSIEHDVVHLAIQGGLHVDCRIWDYSKENLNVRTPYFTDRISQWWYVFRKLSYPLAAFLDRLTGLERVEIYMSEINYSPYCRDWDVVYLQHQQTLIDYEHRFLTETLAQRNYGNSFSVVRHNGMVSIAPTAHTVCATFSLGDFNSACNKARIDPKINLGSIERLLIQPTTAGPQAAHDATYLYLYLQTEHGVIAPATDMITYAFPLPLRHEIVKPSMRQVLKPYSNTSYAPASGYNSDVYTVHGRICSVRNPNARVPERYWQYVDEFNHMLVPNPHRGVPWEESEVLEKQNRPTQRALFEQFKHVLAHTGNRVTAFMKREAYAKITDPRNISTVPVGQKIRYSKLTYSFKEGAMKPCVWYAFGLDPKSMAERVCAMAARSKLLIDADLSRQDGRKGEFHQTAWKYALLLFFHPSYHSDVHECCDREFYAPASTKYGVVYDVGTSQLSGSPSTTDSNTHANCLEKFITLREQSFTVEGAWNNLGLYGGDDSLDLEVLDPNKLVEVCTNTGNVVKVATRRAGDVVPFLGRLFLHPWTTTQMLADTKRQMCKLGMTTAPKEVPDPIAMRRKAESILISDPNTPVLSQWARAVIRTTIDDPTIKVEWTDASYLVQLYPDHASWPQDPLDINLAIKCIANNLAVDEYDVQKFMRFYDGVKVFEELDHGEILKYEVEIITTVEHRGELLRVPDAPAVAPKIERVRPAVAKAAMARHNLKQAKPAYPVPSVDAKAALAKMKLSVPKPKTTPKPGGHRQSVKSKEKLQKKK